MCCVQVYVCVRLCVYVFECLWVCTVFCVCICVYVVVWGFVCMYLSVSGYVRLCVYVIECMRVYVGVCVVLCLRVRGQWRYSAVWTKHSTRQRGKQNQGTSDACLCACVSEGNDSTVPSGPNTAHDKRESETREQGMRVCVLACQRAMTVQCRLDQTRASECVFVCECVCACVVLLFAMW